MLGACKMSACVLSFRQVGSTLSFFRGVHPASYLAQVLVRDSAGCRSRHSRHNDIVGNGHKAVYLRSGLDCKDCWHMLLLFA